MSSCGCCAIHVGMHLRPSRVCKPPSLSSGYLLCLCIHSRFQRHVGALGVERRSRLSWMPFLTQSPLTVPAIIGYMTEQWTCETPHGKKDRHGPHGNLKQLDPVFLPIFGVKQHTTPQFQALGKYFHLPILRHTKRVYSIQNTSAIALPIYNMLVLNPTRLNIRTL